MVGNHKTATAAAPFSSFLAGTKNIPLLLGDTRHAAAGVTADRWASQ